MNTFGEVNWDTNIFNGKGDKNGKDLFLRLEDGPNTVRIVTKPHQYLVHKNVKKEGDKGFGQKINCCAVNGACPLCEQGMPVGPRWFLGVIDRKSNSYKLLDISSQVFSGIKSFANNIKWGDPNKYDVDIVKNSNADPQHYYQVVPSPHTPLSASDQKIIDEQVDLEDLKRRTSPPTADKVQERLEKILAGGKLAKVEDDRSPKGKTASKTSKAVIEAEVVGDEDDVFPPA